MRVLIAEDDQKLLKSLLHIFKQNKLAADGVTDGDEALAYALSGEYDGLILDVMMPGLDSLMVLKTLRAEGVTTPALFLTAGTEAPRKAEGLDAGGHDCLAKPFSTQELMVRVRAMLKRKEDYAPDSLSVRGNILHGPHFKCL